jgi:hypothetical protein
VRNQRGVAIGRRIRGEVAVDVLDQLTAGSADRDRHQHRRPVGTATAERDDPLALDGEEPGHHNDAMGQQGLAQPAGIDRDAVGRRAFEAGLVHREAGRHHAEGAQAQRQQGDGACLARGPQQIQQRLVRRDRIGRRRAHGTDGRRLVTKRVGVAVLRRHHDDESRPWIADEPRCQVRRGGGVAGVPGEHRAPDLEHRHIARRGASGGPRGNRSNGVVHHGVLISPTYGQEVAPGRSAWLPWRRRAWPLSHSG